MAVIFTYEVGEILAGIAYDLDGVLLRLGIALLTACGIALLGVREWRIRRDVMQQWKEAQAALQEIGRRQRSLADLNRRFTEAEQEEHIVRALLDFIPQVVSVAGISFVPFDERERPMSAISHGTLPHSAMDVWAEYLARPEARHRCQACEAHHSLTDANCPLTPPASLDELSSVRKMHCRRLWCGTRQMGMITLYLDGTTSLNDDTARLLDTVLSDAALRLDSIRLRQRELAALQQLQNLRDKRDTRQLVQVMLENILRIFDADFAMTMVSVPAANAPMQKLISGTVSGPVEAFAEGLLRATLQASEPVLVDNLKAQQSTAQPGTALIAAPLRLPENTPLGALLVGSNHPVGFTRRHLDLLQVIAGQIALFIQNANLIAELEYHAILSERLRLAREIHDGLAQTLGFIKLQGAQMRTFLRHGDTQRLQQSLEAWYQAVSEAYQDVREAIDGLRATDGERLSHWVQQSIDEFQSHTHLPVKTENLEMLDNLPPEVQVQLLRIIQESFVNIRKHAQASHVWLRTWQTSPQELSLEIRDNGIGFAPQDVSPFVRHGLEGMRERAELLGAEFQVISQVQQGTSILLRLPV